MAFTRSKRAYFSSLPGRREVTPGENQADDTVIASEWMCVYVTAHVSVCVRIFYQIIIYYYMNNDKNEINNTETKNHGNSNK